MRLIDADALKADYGMKDDCADCEKELQGKVRSCEHDRTYSKMDFCGWIDDAPTIDAVQVVRCKDCKYYTSLTAHCEIRGKGLYLVRGRDDFCSSGRRKGETD